MNPDPLPLPDPLVPEAELAAQLSVQRSVFTGWRTAGDLTSPEHYITRGRNEIVLTAAGLAKVATLMEIPPEALLPPAAPALVDIRITARGSNPRNLRGRVLATGERCTIRLQTPRVFASQFALNITLSARPTDTAGVYDYEGKPARRARL